MATTVIGRHGVHVLHHVGQVQGTVPVAVLTPLHRSVVSHAITWEVTRISRDVSKETVQVSTINFHFTIFVYNCYENGVIFTPKTHNTTQHNYKIIHSYFTVDGGWNDWADWTQCSAKCGTGEITRSRQCDSPEPQNGGKKCRGSYTQSVPCNYHKCPGMDELNLGTYQLIYLGVVKTRNAGIWRNIAEYAGISRNMQEYQGIPQNAVILPVTLDIALINKHINTFFSKIRLRHLVRYRNVQYTKI
jgi:hypothetical protein